MRVTENFSASTPGFLEMLRAAGGRYDVVESALVEAKRISGGRAPSLAAVLRIIRQDQTEDLSRPETKRGTPPMVVVRKGWWTLRERRASADALMATMCLADGPQGRRRTALPWWLALAAGAGFGVGVLVGT